MNSLTPGPVGQCQGLQENNLLARIEGRLITVLFFVWLTITSGAAAVLTLTRLCPR